MRTHLPWCLLCVLQPLYGPFRPGVKHHFLQSHQTDTVSVFEWDFEEQPWIKSLFPSIGHDFPALMCRFHVSRIDYSVYWVKYNIVKICIDLTPLTLSAHFWLVIFKCIKLFRLKNINSKKSITIPPLSGCFEYCLYFKH